MSSYLVRAMAGDSPARYGSAKRSHLHPKKKNLKKTFISTICILVSVVSIVRFYMINLIFLRSFKDHVYHVK
jgi:hypothetical protein